RWSGASKDARLRASGGLRHATGVHAWDRAGVLGDERAKLGYVCRLPHVLVRPQAHLLLLQHGASAHDDGRNLRQPWLRALHLAEAETVQVVHRQIEDHERHAIGELVEELEPFDAAGGHRRVAGTLNHPREHVAYGSLVVHEKYDRRFFAGSLAVDVDALGTPGIHSASGAWE